MFQIGICPMFNPLLSRHFHRYLELFLFINLTSIASPCVIIAYKLKYGDAFKNAYAREGQFYL